MHIADAGSCRLSVSPMQGIVDSAYGRCGVSLTVPMADMDMGSCRLPITVGDLESIHWTFKGLRISLKEQFDKKSTSDALCYPEGFIDRFEKRFSKGNLSDSQLAIAGSRFSNKYLRNSKPKSKRFWQLCKGPMPNRFICKKNNKYISFPRPLILFLDRFVISPSP